MERERERNKKTALKRRIKTHSLILNSTPPQAERGRRWLFVAGGVLLLTIVAFLSGVRLGKNLQELKSGEIASPPLQVAKEIVPKESPTQLEEAKENQKALPFPEEKTRPTKAEEPGILPLSPEKSKPSPAKAKYTLQIAALNNIEEAGQLVNHFQNKGYPAYQISGRGVAKGTLYRVRIGHFQSLQEAKEFALKFEKKEKIKPLITSIASE